MKQTKSGKKAEQHKIELSDNITALFHRDSQSVTLISAAGWLALTREETYRLLSLLEAEFKGVVV